MNTQLPILNITGTQNANRPAAPQADSFTADVPFHQVLNKEVDNRNADTQAKPAEAVKDTPAEPVKSTAATDTATPPAKADTTKTASSDDQKDDDKGDKDSEELDAAASAQMLALVANVGQMTAQPVAKKAPAQDMDVLAGDKGKKSAGVARASDQATLNMLKTDDKAKGNSKDSGVSFAGVHDDGKVITEEKTDALATRPAPEKKLSAGPSEVKASKTELQDATAASRVLKAAPEATIKAAEAPPQPTPAAVVPTLQQAMMLGQQAAVSGQAVQRLTPAVGSQGWDQAVGQKLQWMVTGGLQSASLTLNPPDLGPLQVVLHVNNQQADATFITAQPEVKHALEAAMPKLREMMDQAGIQLGQATVNTGTPHQQQGAGNPQQQARSSAGLSGFGNHGDEGDDLNVAVVARPAVTGGQGLVDTFA